MTELEEAVARHYTHGALEAAIRDGLAAAGRSLDAVTADDLAVIDEFHMGGRQATAELAARLGLRPGDKVLDIGSGLGGPARFLVQRFGCVVAGVDLTPEYVRVATLLTRLTGLAGKVSFRTGSALALPFEPGTFDAATLLHVGMNIPDKAGLCREVRRALRPGGAFLVYDVMQIAKEEPTYPVTWADDPARSFLAAPAVYREALAAAGFAIEAEEDKRELALELFRRLRARIAESGPPPLGLHVLMGRDAPATIGNMVCSLERGVIAPIAMLCRGPLP